MFNQGSWGKTFTNSVLLAVVCVGPFYLSGCQSGPKRAESGIETSVGTVIGTIKHLTLEDRTYLPELQRARGQRKSINSVSGFPSGKFSYLLFNSQTGEVVDRQGDDLPLVPASTTKVWTILGALQVLGPEFRFKTSVFYTGRIQNGTLHGDLYLKGSGDPSLSVAHLFSLAQTLARKGIRNVSGRLFYDESELIPQTKIMEIGDESAGHNPGLSALSLDFNRFALRWAPVQGTDSTAVRVEAVTTPDMPGIMIALSPGGKTDEGLTYRYNEAQGGVGVWSMPEDSPVSGETYLPVRQPSRSTALLFSKFCRIVGIEIGHSVATDFAEVSFQAIPRSGVLLASHLSAPLVEISERSLEYSNNLMAELILLAAAKKLAKRPVTLDEAARLLQVWLVKQIDSSSASGVKRLRESGGFGWNTMKLVNGSGLEGANRVTAKQLVGAMAFAESQNFSGRTLESLLPIAGWKGALEKRLVTPESALRVWAKTGSMHYSSCLTGSIYTLRGKRLLFAIMATDLDQRKRIERLGNRVSKAVSGQAGVWGKLARQAQDQLIQDWILSY